MNYFEYYDLEESLLIDPSIVKKAYLIKSREVHPDLSGGNDMDEASYNNAAYTTLSDKFSILKYLFSLYDISLDAAEAPLSKDFLMDMMDINEEVMEAKMDGNTEVVERVKASILGMKNELESQYTLLTDSFNKDVSNEEKTTLLLEAREYYLKMNYIKRLEDNLNNINAEI